MSINANLYIEPTDSELARFDEVESALLETEKAYKLHQLKCFKTAYYNLNVLPAAHPSDGRDYWNTIDELGSYLPLLTCLPELKSPSTVKAYVLLGKMLVHYHLKLDRHLREIHQQKLDELRSTSEFASLSSNERGLREWSVNHFIYLAEICNEMAACAMEDIAVYSLPNLDQLDIFPPGSEIFEFGYAASLNKFESYRKLVISKSVLADQAKGLYLLAAGQFKSAAENFELIRSRVDCGYHRRALTAWANLAWLLHSDGEQARRRFARSISRIATYPHPNAEEDTKIIETAKKILLWEEVHIEGDDANWLPHQPDKYMSKNIDDIYISKNIYEELTYREVAWLENIEAALFKSGQAEQLDLFRKLKTHFCILHSESDSLPTDANDIEETMDESESFLELVHCLPELKNSRELESFVLLAKMLVHFYLCLAQHNRKMKSEGVKKFESRSKYLRQRDPKTTGYIRQSLRHWENRADKCETMALGTVQKIIEYSLPRLENLNAFPPDSGYFEFGYSAISSFEYRINNFETKTMKFPVSHWVEALYLLTARRYESAAKSFERSRSQETEAYRKELVTAWANLAWLLHSDEEQTRKRYADSIARVASNRNPDAKKEAEKIETLNWRLSGKDLS